MARHKEKIEQIEGEVITETTEAESKPVKKTGKYIALVGCDTSDGKRFEVGDELVGVKNDDLEALLLMNAIKEEK